ncbi:MULTISPECIES: hypothetical protein [unclassified Thalassolituus]|nr:MULTISPECIES: hypothetical protein [unclassified Thalassolituus]|tara:strand:+ start:492 stop:623 length:132 start_codon:yes stop_codon:yes gene_type:complete
MKKPDILILLTVVFLFGAAVTSAMNGEDPNRPERLMSLENSIR